MTSRRSFLIGAAALMATAFTLKAPAFARQCPEISEDFHGWFDWQLENHEPGAVINIPYGEYTLERPLLSNIKARHVKINGNLSRFTLGPGVNSLL